MTYNPYNFRFRTPPTEPHGMGIAKAGNAERILGQVIDLKTLSDRLLIRRSLVRAQVGEPDSTRPQSNLGPFSFSASGVLFRVLLYRKVAIQPPARVLGSGHV
jgi:hypothetical protein